MLYSHVVFRLSLHCTIFYRIFPIYQKMEKSLYHSHICCSGLFNKIACSVFSVPVEQCK